MKSKIIQLFRKIVHFYIHTFQYECSETMVADIVRISEPDKSIFYGYHDKIPFSKDESLILAHRGDLKSTNIEAIAQYIDVGYYKLNEPNPSFQKLGRTSSWCWQQGSMLQFVPNTQTSQVIFNVLVSGELGSRVVDLSGNIIKEYAFPVYSLSPCGKYASTLNFYDLALKRPGYGYYQKEIENIGKPHASIIELSSGAKVMDLPLPEGNYYINHISFSPDSQMVVYFLIEKKGSLRTTSIQSINLKQRKSSSTILNEERCSHFCWLNNQEILVSIGKKVFWAGYIINTKTGNIRIAKNRFDGDFHPMKHPFENGFISDSYVVNRSQKLMYCDLETGKIHVLKNFDVNPELKGEVRCDLHPRFSQSGNFVAIDIGRRENRELNILKLK